MAAGAEHLPQVVDLFTRLADRFANFIESADKSGSLDTFMDRGLKALEQIAEIGINAIKIVNDLSNAFEGDLLQTIVDLTDKLHDFLSSPEGQTQAQAVDSGGQGPVRGVASDPGGPAGAVRRGVRCRQGGAERHPAGAQLCSPA